MLTDQPQIIGVHGTLKRLVKGEDDTKVQFFDSVQMRMLREQQVRCVEYIDGLIGKLNLKAPENTFFIVTADHGELFWGRWVFRARTVHARQMFRGAIHRGHEAGLNNSPGLSFV